MKFHGTRVDALFLSQTIFFLSFSKSQYHLSCYLYTQSERVRRFLQMGSSTTLLGSESRGQCIVQRQRKCNSSYQTLVGGWGGWAGVGGHMITMHIQIRLKWRK